MGTPAKRPAAGGPTTNGAARKSLAAPFPAGAPVLSLAVVRLDDVARNPAPLGNVVTVLVRPLADRLVLIAAGTARRGRSGPAGSSRCAAAVTAQPGGGGE